MSSDEIDVANEEMSVDLTLEDFLEISYSAVIRAVCLSVSEMMSLLKKLAEIDCAKNCSEKEDIKFSVANFTNCTTSDEIDFDRAKLDRKNVCATADCFEISMKFSMNSDRSEERVFASTLDVKKIETEKIETDSWFDS